MDEVKFHIVFPGLFDIAVVVAAVVTLGNLAHSLKELVEVPLQAGFYIPWIYSKFQKNNAKLAAA